jgi:hypothetical protein
MSPVLLEPGHLIPHFTITTLEGREARYADLWQRCNLVLFALPRSADNAARDHLLSLQERLSEVTPDDTAVLAGHLDPSMPKPTLLICDRWGEIAHLQELSEDVASWPSIHEILEWVQFIRVQCPECPPM